MQQRNVSEMFLNLGLSASLLLKPVRIGEWQYLWRSFTFFYLKLVIFGGIVYFKEVKIKGKFPDNLGQNIRRIFHVLAVFPSTTSETELHYYQYKWMCELFHFLNLLTFFSKSRPHCPKGWPNTFPQVP